MNTNQLIVTLNILVAMLNTTIWYFGKSRINLYCGITSMAAAVIFLTFQTGL